MTMIRTRLHAPSLSSRRGAATFGLLLALATGSFAAPSRGVAQCAPDADFCAEVQSPRGSARVEVRHRRRVPAPPPPPPVVVQPAPPTAPPVVVQPAPPPPPPVVVQPAPPPPAPVVVQPAPPPPAPVVVQPQPVPPQRVIVVQPQPAPQPYVVQPAPVPQRYAPPPRRRRGWQMEDAVRRKVGIFFRASGIISENVQMGGIAGGLRLRLAPMLAVDLGAGLYGGIDYNGDQRYELPLTADLLLYLNPRRRAQFYLLGGVGTSFARVETGAETRDLRHVGAQVGAGFEFRIAPAFALNADFRVFARRRIDDDPRPEFVETDSSGRITRSTDTSAGATFNFGATIYFGR